MLSLLSGEFAGLLSLVGFVPYIYDILRGKCTPNRATWFIWTMVGTILCLAQFDLSNENLEAFWVPFSYVIGPALIFLLSLKYGEGGYTKFDGICLYLSFLGLVFWVWFEMPVAALLLNIGIDTVGAIPTLKKTYFDPSSESVRAWSLFAIANSINMHIALGPGPWEQTIYPLYLLTLSLAILCLAIRKIPILRSEKKPTL